MRIMPIKKTSVNRKGLLPLVALVMFLPLPLLAQDLAVEPADTLLEQQIDEVMVAARRPGTKSLTGAVGGVVIGREELFKAACCNLGESFTTNPSVDVSYSDAATGAKQIRLLGLSGIYVQMLTENLPNFRGAATPYALEYVPGSWMKSIQVSKGSSSVRHGYESITGQIDIEYLKPEDEPGVTVNLFGNSMGRMEANADANVHFNERLSTVVLAHVQQEYGHHDQNNDGFLDQPNVGQWNLQNRWKWQGERYIFHGGIGALKEKREGGQMPHAPAPLYQIGIGTDRYEGYMKHAFIFDAEHGTNLALMGNLSWHRTDALYGIKHYDANERDAYAQLLFETHFTEHHNLSTGLSLNHYEMDEKLEPTYADLSNYNPIPSETTVGAYAQYTYALHEKLTAMAGFRADHSSRYGLFFTPRFHLKISPSDVVSLRLSAGKGYRSVHALAENHNLLSSGRQLVVDDLQQEMAWNYGASVALYIPLGGNSLKMNAEYFHTHFYRQTVIDYDSDPTRIHISNLMGRSYSNTLQIDASYPVVSGLELMAAWRLNDVRSTYGGILREKPLTSRYKGLLTVSYKTPLELWQFDATLQLNGPGRMPTPYTLPDGSPSWEENFPAYEQLSAQITRWFRHFSIYIGGENLTGFRQQVSIINAANPWSDTFDPTLVWGPVRGAMGYLGVRVNIGKL